MGKAILESQLPKLWAFLKPISDQHFWTLEGWNPTCIPNSSKSFSYSPAGESATTPVNDMVGLGRATWGLPWGWMPWWKTCPVVSVLGQSYGRCYVEIEDLVRWSSLKNFAFLPCCWCWIVANRRCRWNGGSQTQEPTNATLVLSLRLPTALWTGEFVFRFERWSDSCDDPASLELFPETEYVSSIRFTLALPNGQAMTAAEDWEPQKSQKQVQKSSELNLGWFVLVRSPQMVDEIWDGLLLWISCAASQSSCSNWTDRTCCRVNPMRSWGLWGMFGSIQDSRQMHIQDWLTGSKVLLNGYGSKKYAEPRMLLEELMWFSLSWLGEYRI